MQYRIIGLICALMISVVSGWQQGALAEDGVQKQDVPVKIYRKYLSEARISLVPQDNNPQDPALHITAPVHIQGCAHVGRLRHTIRYGDTAVDISIDGYNLFHAFNRPGLCASGTQSASVRIPLDADKIRDNNINRLFLKSRNIMDVYKMDWGGDVVILRPADAPRFFRPAGAAGTQELRFVRMDKDIVLLEVAGTPARDVANKVRSLAARHGMTPADLPETQQARTRSAYMPPAFYYRDQKRRYLVQLENQDRVLIGTINVSVDPDGPYRVSGSNKSYRVYAKRP